MTSALEGATKYVRMIRAAERFALGVLLRPKVYSVSLFGSLANPQTWKNARDIDLVVITTDANATEFRQLVALRPIESNDPGGRFCRMTHFEDLVGITESELARIIGNEYYSLIDLTVLPVGWVTRIQELNQLYQGPRTGQYGGRSLLEVIRDQQRMFNPSTGLYA